MPPKVRHLRLALAGAFTLLLVAVVGYLITKSMEKKTCRDSDFADVLAQVGAKNESFVSPDGLSECQTELTGTVTGEAWTSIYIADRRTGSRALISRERGWAKCVWSPDSGKIFLNLRRDDDNSGYKCYLRESRKLVQIMRSEGFLANCFWSPDSAKVIIGLRLGSSSRAIAVYSFSSRRLIQLDIPKSLLAKAQDCGCEYDIHQYCDAEGWRDSETALYSVTVIGLKCQATGKYAYNLSGQTQAIEEHFEKLNRPKP